MAVAFTEATMIALHRGLDQTHRVSSRPLELILTEADRNWSGTAAKGRVSP
jgi:hypothetical protein